jgi:hypothetical protein
MPEPVAAALIFKKAELDAANGAVIGVVAALIA